MQGEMGTGETDTDRRQTESAGKYAVGHQQVINEIPGKSSILLKILYLNGTQT